MTWIRETGKANLRSKDQNPSVAGHENVKIVFRAYVHEN